jgi:hypothetical protein
MSKLFLILLGFVAGCVEVDNIVPSAPSETPPPASAPISMTGVWHHTSNVRNQSLGMLCTSTGTLSLDQPDSTFTGTYEVTSVCSSAGGTTTGQNSGLISGEIHGASVFFTNDAGCIYSGTVRANPADQASGTGLCNSDVGGTIYSFTGTWLAGKANVI